MEQIKTSHFFACLDRLRLIQRWSLMRNIERENLAEHSLQVAFVAHALALIKNIFFDNYRNLIHLTQARNFNLNLCIRTHISDKFHHVRR